MNDEQPKDVYYIPSTVAPVIPQPKKRNTFKLDKKDVLFTLIAVALSFLIVDFVLFHGLSLGATIVFFLLFIIATAYLYKKGNKPSVFSVICGTLSLVGSVTLTLYSDKLMKGFMLFLIAGLFSVYACGISATFRNKEGSFKMLTDLACSAFVAPFKGFGTVLSSYKGSYTKNSKLKGAVIGVAVSLPVLLVIVPLLSSSDAAFSGLVTLVIRNIGIYILELLIALVIAPYIISYLVSKRKNLKTGAENASSLFALRGFINSSAAIAFLSVISLTYVIYLFSQLAYFFSAFSGILPQGYEFTESAYARRGFFEMFAICVINIALISLVNIFLKREKGRRVPLALKLLSVFIMLFTTLLLVTAAAKMKMCLGIFGLSKNRVLVCAFMLMLLVMIIFYIIHIFAPKISYMQCVIVICSIIFIALSYADVDGTVIRYNIDAYESGKIASLDVDYIDSLSDEAIPYLVELSSSDDKAVAQNVRIKISNFLRKNYNDEFRKAYNESVYTDIKPSNDNDFREYNASTGKVKKVIADYYNSLSVDEREMLIVEYKLDTCDYDYDSDTDCYEVETDKSIYHFKYNESTEMYELDAREAK